MSELSPTIAAQIERIEVAQKKHSTMDARFYFYDEKPDANGNTDQCFFFEEKLHMELTKAFLQLAEVTASFSGACRWGKYDGPGSEAKDGFYLRAICKNEDFLQFYGFAKEVVRDIENGKGAEVMKDWCIKKPPTPKQISSRIARILSETSGAIKTAQPDAAKALKDAAAQVRSARTDAALVRQALHAMICVHSKIVAPREFRRAFPTEAKTLSVAHEQYSGLWNQLEGYKPPPPPQWQIDVDRIVRRLIKAHDRTMSQNPI